MASAADDPRLQRIHAVVDSVPRGRVATYGQVAVAAHVSNPRHVGAALRRLPPGSSLPWHRIVNARGEISRRGPAAEREQLERLVAEGVEPDARGRIDLERYGWRPD